MSAQIKDGAPVDVLAVMDDHANGIELARKRARGGCRNEISAGLLEFRDARAAMAELIEADRQLDKCEAAVASHVVSEEADEAWEATALELYRARDVAAGRRAAALAGVGGES